MITSIKLQPTMDCNYICKKFHEAITNYRKDNNNIDLTDHIVIITIKQPYDDSSLIPKLEHKNIST